jgi:hypothetical protein
VSYRLDGYVLDRPRHHLKRRYRTPTHETLLAHLQYLGLQFLARPSVLQQAVEIVIERPNCRVRVTRKRALENDLHLIAVEEVIGLDLNFGDDDDVADRVAQARFERQDHELTWKSQKHDTAKQQTDDSTARPSAG